MVLIFGITSCGLYPIYWNIKATEVFNAVSVKEVVKQPKAIFQVAATPQTFIFCLAGKERLTEVYKRYHSPQKVDVVSILLLGFLFPMVATLIVQSDTNKFYN